MQNLQLWLAWVSFPTLSAMFHSLGVRLLLQLATPEP
jgi:hypothetical protein